MYILFVEGSILERIKMSSRKKKHQRLFSLIEKETHPRRFPQPFRIRSPPRGDGEPEEREGVT